MTPGTNRRLRILATTQIACSFVLLAGAGTLLATLNAMQTANTGFDMRKVLAIDVPPTGVDDKVVFDFFQQATRRLGDLPGVEGVASGLVVPWRDYRDGLKFQFTFEGYQRAEGEDDPTCRFRPISPRFFAVLGVPILAGRDFTDQDRDGTDLVAIVSQSLAQRMFPSGDAVNRNLWFASGRRRGGPPRRIVGVVADVDDQNVIQEPSLAVYVPYRQITGPSRLFVRAAGDPHALIPSVTRTLRHLSADQAIERPMTLEEVRTQVLAPDRLNAFVFSGFGGIALLIAIVGVAGVLAFSVSARTREFGVRLAVGATPWQVLTQVLREGLGIVAIGITAGAAFGYGSAWLASRYLEALRMPGVLPAVVAAVVLVAAALAASLMPAARASRVDVLQALRSE